PERIKCARPGSWFIAGLHQLQVMLSVPRATITGKRQLACRCPLLPCARKQIDPPAHRPKQQHRRKGSEVSRLQKKQAPKNPFGGHGCAHAKNEGILFRRTRRAISSITRTPAFDSR